MVEPRPCRQGVGVIPLEEQQAIVSARLEDAFAELVQRLHYQKAFIFGKALERLAAGFGEFGDAIFCRAHDQLEREIVEELADSINYVAAILYREGAGR